jgi:hypothetical protein
MVFIDNNSKSDTIPGYKRGYMTTLEKLTGLIEQAQELLETGLAQTELEQLLAGKDSKALRFSVTLQPTGITVTPPPIYEESALDEEDWVAIQEIAPHMYTTIHSGILLTFSEFPNQEVTGAEVFKRTHCLSLGHIAGINKLLKELGEPYFIKRLHEKRPKNSPRIPIAQYRLILMKIKPASAIIPAS